MTYPVSDYRADRPPSGPPRASDRLRAIGRWTHDRKRDGAGTCLHEIHSPGIARLRFLDSQLNLVLCVA
jgi:hypothetical protein